MSKAIKYAFIMPQKAGKETFRKTFALVEKAAGIPARKIVGRHRDEETSFARAAICNYFMVRHGVPSTIVGTYVNRDHSTVLRIVASLRQNKEARKKYEQLFGRIDGKDSRIH